MFEIFFLTGIILLIITQQIFASKLKLHAPEQWASLGKPGILNPGDHLGVMIYVLSGEYKTTKKKELITSGTLYRLCLGGFLIAVIAYFALPLSFWYG
jgi:hypothetical protein